MAIVETMASLSHWGMFPAFRQFSGHSGFKYDDAAMAELLRLGEITSFVEHSAGFRRAEKADAR